MNVKEQKQVNNTIMLVAIVCLVVAFAAGIFVGRPYPVFLGDFERASIEADCDTRNSGVVERNKELIANNTKWSKTFDLLDVKLDGVKDAVEDLNESVWDTNRLIVDVNC